MSFAVTALHWAALNIAWVLGFAVLEFSAIRSQSLTLSRFVYDLNVQWPISSFLFGLVIGGLAVHFYWHWNPPGSNSIG